VEVVCGLQNTSRHGRIHHIQLANWKLIKYNLSKQLHVAWVDLKIKLLPVTSDKTQGDFFFPKDQKEHSQKVKSMKNNEVSSLDNFFEP
jgi:hypothetical protein